MNHLISIIVPVFKVEDFIEKCARSLFEQTYKNIEYIFVDDCSPDNSINILTNILEEYPHRKKQTQIITHEVNKGLPTARNSGLKLATGEYIFHCDSDDWIETNAIEEMYNTIVKENADILWCDYYDSFYDKEILCKQNNIENNHDYVKKIMTRKVQGIVWNKLYKKSIFFENNIWFPDNYNMFEDLITNIKLFHFAKKIVYLPKSFYHYCKYNQNAISLGWDTNKVRNEEVSINLTNVICFLERKNITIYDKEINILKLASKERLLHSLDKTDFRKWRNIFPESNKYIFKYSTKPLHFNLLGFAISKKLWILTDLWIFLKKIKHKLK